MKRAVKTSPPLIESELFDYTPIRVGKATFLGGLSERVHGWFRLTPSFGPDLVHEMIEELGVRSPAHIHDPFSGAGTTAIETSLEGFQSSCVEVNPFLHFVNKVCLDWSLQAIGLEGDLEEIARRYEAFKASSQLDQIEEIGVSIPPIHNVDRWWRRDVLHALLCLKASILATPRKPHREFFQLCLASVLVPDLTNVTLGKLQLHFIDRSSDTIDVWATFESQAQRMIADLAALNGLGALSTTTLVHGDSTKAETYERLAPIDAVITSPPYPNRYSYVWNTRPHLYMLDFITEARAASEIDRRTIGGTWGTATSELMKGVRHPISAGVDTALQGVHDRIRRTDNLMANYVVHYFNRLATHLEALSARLSANAGMAYVVGNSWIKGEYVATDEILGRMIENFVPGMTTTRLHRFRRRHSGKDLFESIVYAKR